MYIDLPKGKTFFGLEIHDDRLVKLADILALPFADFWQVSASGATVAMVDGEAFVDLHDWENFCTRFVATGTHRFQEP